jgi:erythromycin esterase-like protein
MEGSMAMRTISWFSILFAAACNDAVACGVGTHDDGMGRCVPDDAGEPVADASTPDAGTPDAGPFDAGPPPLPGDVHVLDGIGDEGTDAAYAALDPIVEGGDVLGLGLVTYTSGGVLEAQSRVLRYLVEHHGVRALAIQSPWGQWSGLAETECADPAAALRERPFALWAAEEMVATLTWICEWNAEHPTDTIVLFAFDPQQPWDDGPALRAFFTSAAGADAEALSAGLASCAGASQTQAEFYAGRPIQMTADGHAACHAGLDAIDLWIDENEAAAIAASSAEEVAYARVRARAIRSFEDLYWHFDDATVVRGNDPDDVAANNAYGSGLADTFLGLRAIVATDRPAVILAHEVHVMRAAVAVAALGGSTNMGEHLATELGDDYVVIGTAARELAMNWPGVLQGFYPSFDEEPMIEQRLHELGATHALLDLRADAGGVRMLAPDEEVQLGPFGWMVLDDQMDALIYLERSEGIEALLW